MPDSTRANPGLDRVRCLAHDLEAAHDALCLEVMARMEVESGTAVAPASPRLQELSSATDAALERLRTAPVDALGDAPVRRRTHGSA